MVLTIVTLPGSADVSCILNTGHTNLKEFTPYVTKLALMGIGERITCILITGHTNLMLKEFTPYMIK